METFDEVVDDLSSVVDGSHRRRQTAGYAIDALLVHKKHPFEDSVLLHQVHIRRDRGRWRRRGLRNKIADLSSNHADGESYPARGKESPPTEGMCLYWLVWHNRRVRCRRLRLWIGIAGWHKRRPIRAHEVP